MSLLLCGRSPLLWKRSFAFFFSLLFAHACLLPHFFDCDFNKKVLVILRAVLLFTYTTLERNYLCSREKKSFNLDTVWCSFREKKTAVLISQEEKYQPLQSFRAWSFAPLIKRCAHCSALSKATFIVP